MKKLNKNQKIIGAVVAALLLVFIAFKVVPEVQLHFKIRSLEKEIEAIEAARYSGDSTAYEAEYGSLREEEDVISNLELENLSASASNGLVQARGTIRNLSSSPIEEVIKMAFLDENGAVISVRLYRLNIAGNGVDHFEELVGITKDGTKTPSTVQLLNN